MYSSYSVLTSSILGSLRVDCFHWGRSSLKQCYFFLVLTLCANSWPVLAVKLRNVGCVRSWGSSSHRSLLEESQQTILWLEHSIGYFSHSIFHRQTCTLAHEIQKLQTWASETDLIQLKSDLFAVLEFTHSKLHTGEVKTVRSTETQLHLCIQTAGSFLRELKLLHWRSG